MNSKDTSPTGERLRDLAGPFLIGFASANDFWNFTDAAIYQDTARREFNCLTPENQLKWEVLHPQPAVYNFAPADRHVQFAQANNMLAHGHPLVWHNQLPGWLTGSSWTGAALLNVLYDHIDTVLEHYQGKVFVWDVVNEAFEDDGVYRTTLWQTTLGQQYLELAFRRARAAAPNARLIYNDYLIEELGVKSDAVYRLATDFKQRGVPLDGIGLQMHLSNTGLNFQSFADNMQRFADLGLEIYITEMDVRFPTPLSPTNLNYQALIYGSVLKHCLTQPACKALQTWGFTDKYSWVPGFFTGFGEALIFDADYRAKPAYYALQSELKAMQR